MGEGFRHPGWKQGSMAPHPSHTHTHTPGSLCPQHSLVFNKGA